MEQAPHGQDRVRMRAGIALLVTGAAIIAAGIALAFAGSGAYSGSPWDGMHLWLLPGGALAVGGLMLLRPRKEEER
jgi:hypothetical protein